MSNWAVKRFWDEATVSQTPEGFGVLLDGKTVMTPAKVPLLVPTATLADAIAAEWQAQEGKIDPTNMPFTGSANAAIDKVGSQHTEVAELVADYGGSDLLCYRADSPTELSHRQSQAWDPILDWAATDLGARLKTGTGIMPIAQDAGAIAALNSHVFAFDAFELTAFHDLVSLSGSLVLGLAVTKGKLAAESAWDSSRIDEDWQQEQWGEDDEAVAAAAVKRTAFQHAATFFVYSQVVK